MGISTRMLVYQEGINVLRDPDDYWRSLRGRNAAKADKMFKCTKSEKRKKNLCFREKSK